jgi:hypothetical protein
MAVLLPAVLVLLLVLQFASRVWLWRVRGDEIRIDGDRVQTRLGTFQYDRIGRSLRVDLGAGRTGSVLAPGPARVILIPDMESALLKEALWSLIGATDFGVADLLPRYRDQMKSVTITLDCDGRQVPMARLSQYRAHDALDFLGGNASLRDFLSGLRLYRELDAVAEARGFEIADALRRQGLAVSFG